MRATFPTRIDCSPTTSPPAEVHDLDGLGEPFQRDRARVAALDPVQLLGGRPARDDLPRAGEGGHAPLVAAARACSSLSATSATL